MNLMHCRLPKNAHLAITLGFCGRLYVVDLVITAYSIPTRYYNRLETRRKHISALMFLLLLEIKKTAMGREYNNTMKSESIYPGELYRYLQQAALTVLSMSVCLYRTTRHDRAFVTRTLSALIFLIIFQIFNNLRSLRIWGWGQTHSFMYVWL